MNLKQSKNFMCIIIILLFTNNSLFAIAPTSEVTSVGQIEEIGGDIFPVSFFVEYDVYEFNFNEEYPIEMTFDINGGYGTRDMIQDPITGLSTWCENYDSSTSNYSSYIDDYTDDYGQIFTGWEMKFSQNLSISEKIDGSLSAWLSTSSHYEQAVDLLENYRNSDPYNNTIFNQLIEDNQNDIIYKGIRELNNDRFYINNTFKFGTIYKNKINDISLSNYTKFIFSPSWFFNNLDNDESFTNYYRIENKLNLSKTYFKHYYNDLFTNNKFRLFNFNIKNQIKYRYLIGDAVPVYMANYNNVRHDLNNKLSLTLYGPQFLAKDCYPFIQGYYYSDIRWGELNNTNEYEFLDYKFYHKIGSIFELRFIGIIHIGYKIEYNITNSRFYEDNNGFYFYVEI